MERSSGERDKTHQPREPGSSLGNSPAETSDECEPPVVAWDPQYWNPKCPASIHHHSIEKPVSEHREPTVGVSSESPPHRLGRGCGSLLDKEPSLPPLLAASPREAAEDSNLFSEGAPMEDWSESLPMPYRKSIDRFASTPDLANHPKTPEQRVFP